MGPAKRSVELARQFGPRDSRVIKSLGNLGNLTYYSGDIAGGIAILKSAIDTAKKMFGPEDLQISEPLQDLATIYQDQGHLKEAEPLLEEVLKIRRATLRPDHPQLARTCNILGTLYTKEGKLAQAEEMFQTAISAQEKLTGYDRSALAASTANLADLDLQQGKFDQAEMLFKKALDIDETALGPDHPEVAMILGNLGEFYHQLNRLGEAEPLMRRSLAIEMKVLPSNHPQVAAGVKKLADLYRDEGKYAEAEPMYRQALAIERNAYGPDSLDEANTSLNLAVLYTRQFDLSQDKRQFIASEQLLQQALEIQKKRLRPDHPGIAITMERLGNLYLDAGQSATAIPLLQQALAIQKNRVPPDQSEIAQLFWHLGDAALGERKFEQAESYFKGQMAARNANLGGRRPEKCTTDLAVTYFDWGRPNEAEQCFRADLDGLRADIDAQFSYMSDAERLSFMDTFRQTLPLYFSFVAKYPTSESVGYMYDLLLWQKGLVAAGISAMRGRIAASGDSGASALLDQITQKRAQIARLKNGPPDSSAAAGLGERIRQLEIEVNDAERELARKFPPVAGRENTAANWQSIQTRLRKDEAAVEYVRYQYYDQHSFTGASQYAALVLTAASRNSPVFIPLGEAAALECGPVDDYRQIVGMAAACKPCPGQARKSLTFYQAFWKPIEPALAGVHRVYLSGDGALAEISFAAIEDEAGNLLLKKYDLRPVVSTRDLLMKFQVSHQRTAVLVGDPKFNATAEEQEAALLEFSRHSPGPRNLQSAQLSGKPALSAASQTRSMELGDLQWKQLPDTKVELDEIAKLMGSKWRVGSYEGTEALVEAVKGVHGPQVLHIATHGFFLPDGTAVQNRCRHDGQDTARPMSPSAVPARDPLLRAGLVFTGANRGTSRAFAADLGNGVLTAYEAATLDLTGTELVVLSACDTGLGTMFAGEGVLGLRRSFQEAGAESILMSLWEVPSRATEELMKLFYSKWLGGKEKHQALAEAQLELRSRSEFAAPKNWAGFVLVGP